jgi:hypothetical protein
MDLTPDEARSAGLAANMVRRFGEASCRHTLVRVIVGAHIEERACSIGLVGLLSLVAAGVYSGTRSLPA